MPDNKKIDLSVFDEAVKTTPTKTKEPEIDLSVFDEEVKKKDVVVPVQGAAAKAVSVSPSSKGGESVSAPLDEAQTAQVDQPTYMQQQLKEKGLIVDEPKPEQTYFEKEKETVLKGIQAPEERKVVSSALDKTNRYFADMGGKTPYQKMEEFSERAKQISEKHKPKSFVDLTEQDVTKIEQDYKNEVHKLAVDLGLEIDQEGKVSPYQDERALYERKLADNIALATKENKKEVGFFENLANKLASGYESAAGNAIDMLGTATGLNYFDGFKDLSKGNKYRADQFSAQANKYDGTIEDYLKAGDVGKAAGLAFSSAVESLPAMIPAFVNPASGVYVMGAMSGIDKYRQIESADIPEWKKVYNAFITGASEAAGEKLVTMPILARSKQALLSLGEKKGAEAIKNAVKKSVDNSASKLGAMPEWVSEGLSEVATGLSTDLVDKVTINPDIEIGSHAVDDFAVGAVMGKVFSLPQDVAKAMDYKAARAFSKNVIDKLPADMDIETKIDVGWKIAERDKLVEAEDKLDEKFKGKYMPRITALNTEIEKAAAKYAEPKKDEVPVPDAKVDQEPVKEDQNKVDYLQEQGVKIPDGTTMEQLDVLYNETKAKQEEVKPTTKKQEPVVVEAKQGSETTPKAEVSPIEAQNKPVEPLTAPEAAQVPPVKEEGLNQQKEVVVVEAPKQSPIDIKNASIQELEDRFTAVETELLAERQKPNRDQERVDKLDEEWSQLENEMVDKEWKSVFNVSLDKVGSVLDELSKKEKEKPNGYGSVIEKRDIGESKDVVDRYSNAETLSESDLFNDFTSSVRGNPTTWYADGLMLRESVKEATRRGIPIETLIDKAVSVYTKDGYDEETGRRVVAGMLEPVLKGVKTEKAPIASLETNKKQQKGVVVEQPTDFKTELSTLKEQKPEDYWSVDLPTDEVIETASKNGKIIETEGGKAIVKEDGDIVGVYSNKTKSGVFGRLIDGIVKAGGVKLDAYDTKKTSKSDLVSTYEKNGFRVVARVDFNESSAPKDMPSEVRKTKPDVVVMAYDPNGELNIKERRFGKDQYNEALSYRDSYLSEEVAPDHNKSAETQNFFSDVVTGKSDKFKPKRKWEPILPISKALEAVKKVYDKFNGNFDEHIATSIPAFRDVQIRVVGAVNKIFGAKGGLVYDIGGSEGGFVKSITSLSKGKIKSINLDANSDMQKVHNATPVEGSKFVKEAFGEGFEYDGVTYKKHIPKQKADVVHESMTFQFIDHKRADKLNEVVANYLKPDGLFITEEKVHSTDKAVFDANEAKKDNDYKSRYYDKGQLDAKREEVLTGMAKDQTTYERYKNELLKKFDFVEEYWDGGNFKGLVASNDKAKVDTFLKEVGNTETEFSEKNINKQPLVGEQTEVTQLKEEQNGKENGQGRQGLQVEEAPIKEAAKRVADSLRKAKFIQSIDDLSKLSSDPTAILKVAWDGSVEVAAKAIEAGGSVAQAVADGINTLKASEWYKKLSDESRKIAETRFQSDIESHFKEQDNASGIRGQNKTDVSSQKGVVEGAQGKVSVGNDVKDQKTPRGESEVKERQQGKKIIASTTLPEDIKQQFEDEGIEYIPRGEKIRREEAKQIAEAKLQMEGGREQLKSDVLDTTNKIKGDVRVVLARTYVEDSLLKSAQAETATERRKYRDEATEMLHFLMIRSTDIAQELQANKEISEMLAADPEMIEDVYRKEIAKKNADFYSANKEPIKSAKQIIDDYLNSKEFKEKYKPKPDLSDNGKTSPRERRERGIAKIADAMSKIASLTGAKKNFVEEDFQRGSSLRDAISELASGILDVGVASTEELITKIKINTRKFLTSSEVDKIAKDVINETDAANRITPKKTRKVKLDKEDEAKLVARLYGKMTDATEGQLRRLIADNIELFEREGSINDAAFKELFAKALGKDYVSDDVINQLKKSAQIIFDVKVIEDDIKRLFENALKLQNEGAAQSAIKDIQKQIDARLKDHRLAVHEAEKANKYISESFSDPKTILTILGSNIQGNLVTTQSQLVNIIGNYSMMPIRAPKNFVAWMMDAAIANTIGNLKKPILDAINKKQAAYVSKEAQRLNIPESEVVIPTYFHKYRRFADKLADKELKRTGVGLSKYQFIGQARGFKEGIRQLWTGQLPSDIYKRDMMVALHPLNAMFDNYNMLTGKEKMEFKKFATNSVEALLSAPPEVMFRFLNLFDKPVRRGAELDKLNELANLKGLEGIEKKKFIEMPDEESAEEARIAGDKATFQQDTKLSKASSSLDVTLLKKAKESTNLMSKVGLYLAYFVKKGTVPFVKTPINVTMEMLDYALPHVSFAKGIFAMFAGDRKSFTENMGKAMVGAMINQGIGYLFATGIMSLASGGNEDEDKELISKKVKAAEYRDKPANYINTSALQRLINNQMYGTNESLDWRPGDNMSSYRRFGILSGIAMAHGEAYKGKTKEEIKEMTGLDMARLSFMPVVKSAAEQSFVTGTSALVNALIGSEYERDQYLVSLSKAAGATALPNSLRTYIQANDNYIRETKDKTLKGVDKFKSTLKADFKSSFTSDSGIPTKVTIWGEPVRRYEDGSSPAFQLFDITRSKVYRGDFGAKIFELYEKTKEEDIPEGLSRSDILPPVLGEKFNYEEKEITLDPKTYEDYQIYVGTMLKKDVEAKVNSMEWEKMDTKEKIISLRKSWASSKKSARSLAIEFWKEQNIEKLNELLVKQQGVKIKKENMKKAVNKPKSSASDILSKAR